MCKEGPNDGGKTAAREGKHGGSIALEKRNVFSLKLKETREGFCQNSPRYLTQQWGGGGERVARRSSSVSNSVCLCVCVCVCVRARTRACVCVRERERELTVTETPISGMQILSRSYSYHFNETRCQYPSTRETRVHHHNILPTLLTSKARASQLFRLEWRNACYPVPTRSQQGTGDNHNSHSHSVYNYTLA